MYSHWLCSQNVYLLAKSCICCGVRVENVSGNAPWPTFWIKCAKFSCSWGSCNWTIGACGVVEPAACSCAVCALASCCWTMVTGFCCGWAAADVCCAQTRNTILNLAIRLNCTTDSWLAEADQTKGNCNNKIDTKPYPIIPHEDSLQKLCFYQGKKPLSCCL